MRFSPLSTTRHDWQRWIFPTSKLSDRSWTRRVENLDDTAWCLVGPRPLLCNPERCSSVVEACRHPQSSPPQAAPKLRSFPPPGLPLGRPAQAKRTTGRRARGRGSRRARRAMSVPPPPRMPTGPPPRRLQRLRRPTSSCQPRRRWLKMAVRPARGWRPVRRLDHLKVQAAAMPPERSLSSLGAHSGLIDPSQS